MKNAIKRAAKALALILCLCLTAGAAPAKADALDMVNLLSPWIEGDEAHLSVSYEIKNLLPYNDSTLTLLNNVLKHITVEGRVSGNDTSMGISVDGDSLFTLEETQENGRSVLRTELLPNRELTSAQNALDALFPEDETAEPAEEGTDALPGGSFDLNAALTEAEACYRQLTDAIQPYAEEKKANYTIKNVGKGKWVRLAKLTAEQAEALKPQIAAVLSCGMDEAFRQQMESLTLKKGFTVALYRTAEDGDDLAVYIKGNAAIEDVNYTIAYQWAFARGENGNDTDTYKLEFNRPKGKIDKRTAEASRTQSVSEDGRKLTVQSSLELKEGKLTLTTTRKYDLTGRDADGGTAVSGSIVDTVKQQDSKEKTSSTTSTELVPELKWAGGVLSGTVNVARLNGKTPAGEYVLHFGDTSFDPVQALAAASSSDDSAPTVQITIDGSSVQQNTDTLQAMQSGSYQVGETPVGVTEYTAPSTLTTVDLDTADAAALAALQGELFRANYMRPIHDWCRRNGVRFTGHLDIDHMTDGCMAHGYGTVLQQLREFDVPGVDVIWRQIDIPKDGKPACYEGNGFFERFASSAAAQTGGTLAVTESFGVYGASLTGKLARFVILHQLARGVNVFNFMCLSYTPKNALALVERPEYVEEMPGFFHLRGLNDFTARASWLMQLGAPAARAALYFPARDIWAGGTRAKNAIDGFERLGQALERAQVDFDILDEEGLRASAVEEA